MTPQKSKDTILELLDELKNIMLGRSKKEILEKPILYRFVERLVQIVIQALLDLGSMLISALGLGKPESYVDMEINPHGERHY